MPSCCGILGRKFNNAILVGRKIFVFSIGVNDIARRLVASKP
jgi:sRNA-binding carbon storage regulator CsrA